VRKKRGLPGPCTGAPGGWGWGTKSLPVWAPVWASRHEQTLSTPNASGGSIEIAGSLNAELLLPHSSGKKASRADSVGGHRTVGCTILSKIRLRGRRTDKKKGGQVTTPSSRVLGRGRQVFFSCIRIY